MIGEKEFYHGAALARLVQNAQRPISVESWSSVSRSAYVLDDAVGIYLKYSTKRLSPWVFEFTAEHGLELKGLREAFSAVWLVLVCGPVGIVTANWSNVERDLVSLRADASFSLSTSKKAGEKFRVAGSGTGPVKISESAYPEDLFAHQEVKQRSS